MEKQRLHLSGRKLISLPECEKIMINVPENVNGTCRECCPPMHPVHSSSALHGPYRWHSIPSQPTTPAERAKTSNSQGEPSHPPFRPRPRYTKSSVPALESPLDHHPSRFPGTTAPENDASLASHQRTTLASRSAILPARARWGRA